MRWGLTNEERRQRRAAAREWHPVFLWLPRELATGQTAWLERVWRRESTRYRDTWEYVSLDTSPLPTINQYL